MAIVINGDGSISGISAGGLPTGSVTADTLATNSVDSDELVNGAIDAGHLASGVGGAWTLIGTQTASASASLTQTGLDSTYDCYAVVGTEFLPATDFVDLHIRLGDSGGIDSGASDYDYHANALNVASSAYNGVGATADAYIRTNGSWGNASTEGGGIVFYIYRSSDDSSYPHISGTVIGGNTSGGSTGGVFVGARLSAIVMDRVQLYFSSGNIASGRMSVYGIAHT